jgi:hypothetical protein
VGCRRTGILRGVKLGPHVMEAGLELCDFGLEVLRLRRVEQHFVADIESGVYNPGKLLEYLCKSARGEVV